MKVFDFSLKGVSLIQKRSLIYLLLSFSYSVFSQQLYFKNFNTEDGLPSPEIYSVFKDSKGFIWFATDAGVSRYDGYKFRNLGAMQGLPDNTIFGMEEDPKGRLWFRGLKTLAYYENGRVHAIWANEKLKTLITTYSTSLFIDKDTVYLSCLNQGYFKITPPYKDYNIAHCPLSNPIIKEIGNGFFYSVNRLSPLVLSTKEAKSFSFPLDTHLPPNLTAISYKLKNGQYIFCRNKTLYLIDKNRIKSFKITNGFLLSFFEDKDENIWIGTNKGLLFYKKGQLEERNKKIFLSHLSISGITEDFSGGIWISSLTDGCFYLKNKNIFYVEKNKGLPMSAVNAVCSLDSSLIFGFDNGDISTLVPGGNERLVQRKTNPLGRILTIQNVDNKIWVGTNSNIEIWDKAFHKRYSSIDFKNIKSMVTGKDNSVWIGNHTEIIKIKKFKIVKRIATPGFRSNSLYEDQKGILWVGSSDGLRTYQGNGFYFYGKVNTLPGSKISDIKALGDSQFIATKGNGLVIRVKDKVFSIKRKQGLASDFCKKIFIEKNHNVWIGTNEGLSKITFSNHGFSIQNFNINTGLISNEINDIYVDDDNAWVCTNKGIAYFKPSDISYSVSPPDIFIDSVTIAGKSLDLSKPFQLSYTQNYLFINYLGLSFPYAGNINYKYKMEGLDSVWKYTTNTSIQYTSLPSGTYKFLIYAGDKSGSYCKVPAYFSFSISLPFWKTWWFIALSVVIGGSLTIAFFHFRWRTIKLKAIEKEKIQFRIAKAELEALRAQMNPHFIFNALNSIQAFILENESKIAHLYLVKFSRLIRSVLENSRLSLISLAQEIETLELYIELEHLRFEQKFQYSINVQEGISFHNTFIPSMLIQPYVENAIWHGLMHKEEEGKLEINIKRGEGVLVCTIEDNGIGRKRSKELKKNSLSQHKSMALQLSLERLSILSKQFNKSFYVEIEDLTDPSGTKVTIVLPLI